MLNTRPEVLTWTVLLLSPSSAGALPVCGAGGRGSLKIDLDFAHGAGNAVDRIPIEGLAIDAVGRRSLGAIQGDAHVMQLGVAVALVLHRLGGVQGVDGVPAPRLRIGKAFGRLLD